MQHHTVNRVFARLNLVQFLSPIHLKILCSHQKDALVAQQGNFVIGLHSAMCDVCIVEVFASRQVLEPELTKRFSLREWLEKREAVNMTCFMFQPRKKASSYPENSIHAYMAR